MRARRWFEPDCGQTTHDMSRRALEQPRSVAEAQLLQERLRDQVVTEDLLGVLQRVAGVDAHYGVDRLWAAIVVMTFPALVIVESALIQRALSFPYVPGLLAFREAPAILEVLHRLSEKPDLLLVDGQGLAHPRRFGLACHLGVLGNLPTDRCQRSAIWRRRSRCTGHFRLPAPIRAADTLSRQHLVG